MCYTFTVCSHMHIEHSHWTKFTHSTLYTHRASFHNSNPARVKVMPFESMQCAWWRPLDFCSVSHRPIARFFNRIVFAVHQYRTTKRFKMRTINYSHARSRSRSSVCNFNEKKNWFWNLSMAITYVSMRWSLIKFKSLQKKMLWLNGRPAIHS